jgi:hypothetical protein
MEDKLVAGPFGSQIRDGKVSLKSAIADARAKGASIGDAIREWRDAWEEGKHPRDGGKFASGPRNGGASAAHGTQQPDYKEAGKTRALVWKNHPRNTTLHTYHGPFRHEEHARAYATGMGLSQHNVASGPHGFHVVEAHAKPKASADTAPKSTLSPDPNWVSPPKFKAMTAASTAQDAFRSTIRSAMKRGMSARDAIEEGVGALAMKEGPFGSKILDGKTGLQSAIKCVCQAGGTMQDALRVWHDAHMGFAKLDHSLAHRKGVKNPAALAAFIGRKKFGAKGMAAKAAAVR